jgi:hypothetical protein
MASQTIRTPVWGLAGGLQHSCRISWDQNNHKLLKMSKIGGPLGSYRVFKHTSSVLEWQRVPGGAVCSHLRAHWDLPFCVNYSPQVGQVEVSHRPRPQTLPAATLKKTRRQPASPRLSWFPARWFCGFGRNTQQPWGHGLVSGKHLFRPLLSHLYFLRLSDEGSTLGGHQAETSIFSADFSC